MPDRVYFTIGIGFAGGVLLGSLFNVKEESVALVLLLSFALALVWRLQRSGGGSVLLIASVLLLATGCGLMRIELANDQSSVLAALIGEKQELKGVILREPEARATTLHLYVMLDGYNERVLIITDRFNKVSYGDRVTIIGTLTEPKSFETDLGRVFDYTGYLKARGVQYTIPFAEIEVVEHGQGNRFTAALLSGKERFMMAFERAVPEPTAGLGEGVLLGVKRAIGEKIEEDFRDTGIIHIVVLSGYNVMIVVTWITAFLSFFFFPRTRLIVGLLSILAFAVIVGLSATVLRASLMAALLLVARTFGRTYIALRGLVLAGIVMLLHNPYLLAFDPGFVLSFLATLGIILLGPHIEARLSLVPRMLGIREFMTATISTQIFVFPFILYSMGTFSLVSVVVNVLVLPVVSVAMLLSFVTGLAALLHPLLGHIPGFFAHLSLLYIIRTAEFFAAFPFAAFSVSAFSFVWVIVCYTLMGVGIVYLYHRERTSWTSDEPSVATAAAPSLEDWTIVGEDEFRSQMRLEIPVRDREFPFR
jgi:competence protein ComEC